MSASTPEASEDSGEPRRRLRDRFIWQVGSTISWSILQQVLGLLRQVLIAASFGLSREYDGYVVAYSLAVMLVFNLSGVFDTIAVSRLVRIRERDGEEAFWRASNRLLTLSVVASLPFASLFLAALWLTMPIIAAGFSPADRALLGQLGWYFLPWIIIIIPYYALSAHLKVCWQFSWVFATEIIIIVVSAVAVWLDHDRIASLPIAYSFGYAAGALLLLLRRKLKVADPAARSDDFMASMGKQYLAYQVGTATGFAERYYQSFVAAGGISALGYVGLIVNNLSSLLTLREIYVVPLTTEAGRQQRLRAHAAGARPGLRTLCFISLCLRRAPGERVFSAWKIFAGGCCIDRVSAPHPGSLAGDFDAPRAARAHIPDRRSVVVHAHSVCGRIFWYRGFPNVFCFLSALGRARRGLGLAMQWCPYHGGRRRSGAPLRDHGSVAWCCRKCVDIRCRLSALHSAYLGWWRQNILVLWSWFGAAGSMRQHWVYVYSRPAIAGSQLSAEGWL